MYESDDEPAPAPPAGVVGAAAQFLETKPAQIAPAPAIDVPADPPPAEIAPDVSSSSPGASDAAAFEAAFTAELADFHVAYEEEAAPRLLASLRALTAMASDASDGMYAELRDACAAKAAALIQKSLAASAAAFHLTWHEDAHDLLAVDGALQQGFALLADARAAIGDGPLGADDPAVEVLGACEAQLRQRLQAHVRRANRHELRMLYADFCGRDGRDELQALCLEKYREQVDKHVQSEAVNAERKLHHALSLRAAPVPAVATPGGSAATGAAVAADEVGVVGVMGAYLEAVLSLAEELGAAELPSHFEVGVLREVEAEACAQVVELLQNVLLLESALFDAVAEAQAAADARGRNHSPTPGASSPIHDAAPTLALDVRLEEASELLRLVRPIRAERLIVASRFVWCDLVSLGGCREATDTPRHADIMEQALEDEVRLVHEA